MPCGRGCRSSAAQGSWRLECCGGSLQRAGQICFDLGSIFTAFIAASQSFLFFCRLIRWCHALYRVFEGRVEHADKWPRGVHHYTADIHQPPSAHCMHLSMKTKEHARGYCYAAHPWPTRSSVDHLGLPPMVL